jgi:nucleoside-diphosphate-sugar epimerase
MNILLTGGAGFIGSNLAKRLIIEGHNVSIVDNLSSGNHLFVPTGSKFLYYDFSDVEILELIHKQKFSTIIHLAALPRVSYSCEHPSRTTETNVNKTVKLLEACRGNIERFINVSSSSVYGNTKMLPTHEFTPHNPQSPYALQKSITEQFCALFTKLYGFETVSVRPFNVFGTNQKGNNAYATAISSWLYAVKHNKPLRSDGDGTQTRDMTHIDNVIDIFVRIVNQPSGTFKTHQVYNAGTGSSVSNNEILEWFKKEYPNCSIINAPARAGDVHDTLADMSNAKYELGWDIITPFWKGLELTRNWAMSSSLF